VDFEISFEPGRDLMVIRTSGPATVEDVAESMRARVQHPCWRPGLDVLIDHSALDTSGVDAKTVESLLRALEPYAGAVGSGRSALVVPNSITFGFARMFEALAQERLPRRYHVFRSLEEAEAWLAEKPT
jgi:hypothetical protein